MTTASVSARNAVRTPQFWLLWVVLFCNVTAGIGILEQASPMIQDFFRSAGGASTVSVAAAGGFVGLLSMANMAGRFVWSSTSDVIGRKPVYMGYLGVGLVAYFLLATFGQTSTALFVLFAVVILSFYGGGFATVPAYLRDLFGTFQVGAVHGRLLTAWSAAGVAGPLIVNGFLDAQGDPGSLTASAYRPALLTMVAVLAVGFVANLLVRPWRRGSTNPPNGPRRASGGPGERAGPGGRRLGARRDPAGLRRRRDARARLAPVHRLTGRLTGAVRAPVTARRSAGASSTCSPRRPALTRTVAKPSAEVSTNVGRAVR